VPAASGLLANSSDVDGGAASITVYTIAGMAGTQPIGSAVTIPGVGAITIHADGSYSFAPAANYTGPVPVITYTVSDGNGGSDTSTLTLSMVPVNDDPVSTAIADQSSNDSDPVSLDVSGFFSDPDATDVLTFSAGGTLPPGLSIDPNTGIISGTLDSSASAGGPYTVVITAGDGNGGTVTQTFTWNVNNPLPIAIDDSYDVAGAATSTVIGNAIDNDSDPEGDSLSVLPQTNIPGSQGGIFSIAADGTITFDPNGDFDHLLVTDSLATSIQYTLVDADGATTTATITITVIGTNVAPVAQDDHFALAGQSVTGNAFANDFDPNGDSLQGVVTNLPQHGTVVWQTDGSFTYTPGPTYRGSDQFTYSVRDVHGATTSAVVHIGQSFAWDAFRNESKPGSVLGMGVNWSIEQLVSLQLDSMGAQPILAGYATPGAILKGRIYDLSGAELAEATAQVNAAGNWVMNFYQQIKARNVIVIIDHVATEEVMVGDLHHFRLTDDTYRSLQLGTQHHRIMTPGTILSDRPSLVLERMHQQNLNPLALL
jgi:VCBS repeat-containing protein